MSQAMQVLISPAPAANLGGPGNVAQPAESPDSFGDVLAGQLDSGPGEPAPAESPAVTAGPEPETAEPAAVNLAAGKELPPALPPETESLTAALSMSELVLTGEATAAELPTMAAASDSLEVPADADPVPMPSVVPVALPTPAPAADTTARAAAASMPMPEAAAGAAGLGTAPGVTQGSREALPAETFKLVQGEATGGIRQDNLPAPATTLAAGAQVVATETSATATASTPVRTQIDVPLSHPSWGQTFGNRVAWVVNQNTSVAELHLSPPELGPVKVHISLDQEQASIAFSAQHAGVREAIEAALPRLRDMFGAQGIQLVDVNVSAHAFAGRQEHGRPTARQFGGEMPAEDVTSMLGQRQSSGLVDLFA